MSVCLIHLLLYSNISQVKTGMLRSEHQKMALRTIKETVDTELQKRCKERDKDKERLQTQQSVAVATQEPLLEGEQPSVSRNSSRNIGLNVYSFITHTHTHTHTHTQSKAQRQPSNPELTTAESKERPYTPALTVQPETKKSESPAVVTTHVVTSNKTLLETTTVIASSPNTVLPTTTPSVPLITAVIPPPSSLVTSHPPTFTTAPSSTTETVVVTHTNYVVSPAVTRRPSDGCSTNVAVEKGEITNDSHITPLSKQLQKIEGSINQLESFSSSSLSNNQITTSTTTSSSIDETTTSGPLPATDQDTQQPSLPLPPPSDTATPTMTSSQTPLTTTTTTTAAATTAAATSGDKIVLTQAMAGQAASVSSGSVQIVGKMSSEEGHQLPGGTNGGKKKSTRSKGRMMLSLVQVTPDHVVKCMLVTKNEVKINFQFSSRFDETKAIFKKLVSLKIIAFHCVVVYCLFVCCCFLGGCWSFERSRRR